MKVGRETAVRVHKVSGIRGISGSTINPARCLRGVLALLLPPVAVGLVLCYLHLSLSTLMPPAKPWGTQDHSPPSGYPTSAQPARGLIWSDGRFRKPCTPGWLLCLFALRACLFLSQTSLFWACWCRNQGVVTCTWWWEGWLRAQLVKITIAALCYPGQLLLAVSRHDMTLT